MADEPIAVHDSPLPDQLWAGVRQIAPPLLTFALGRHWIPDDLGGVLIVAGGVVWAIVAGQMKTRERAQQLSTIANHVPDSVATIK